MTPEQLREQNSVILEDWADQLIRNHASPVFLVAVGNDHNLGIMSVCCVENFATTDQLVAALDAAKARILAGEYYTE